ncbi:MAG: efflux RND transporter periplasmic adaptor subunit [Pseudomonadota bacterium]
MISEKKLMVLGMFVLFLCQGCGEKIGPGTTPPAIDSPIKVTVSQAQTTLQPIMYEAVGTVQAQVEATLSSQLMGTVQAVTVEEGDAVTEGALLVVLDERQVNARLRQAEAALAEAKKAEAVAVAAKESSKAGAEQAELEYKRNRSLLEGEAITQEQFELIEARYKQAQAMLSQTAASVEAARHRVDQARAVLLSSSVTKKDARVSAPFDGIVIRKRVEVGDLASPGTPLLVLEKSNPYRADFLLPETYVQSVRSGQPIRVQVPAVSRDILECIVDVIMPSADQGSRSFVVKVGLPEQKGLRSGMFARVFLPVGQRPMLLVPETALVYQGQLTGLFIVDAENIARFRLIRTGKAYANGVEVISGINQGTRYVTAPPQQLLSGARVEFSS